MQRSSRNTSNNGRSQHNRKDDNGRRHQDAERVFETNSSIGNGTIEKRNDNDATLNNNANNNNTTNSGGGGENNDRGGGGGGGGGEGNANKNYVDEARMKFEDEIERVARELEAKKLSSKSSTWAGKSTPATAPPSNTANPLRMLVGNSKQQQVVAVAAAEIAAATTPNPTSIAPPSVRREHLTTQQLIEIQLHQQQEQHKRFEQILHQQRAHAKQHQQEEGETGAELLKTRKKLPRGDGCEKRKREDC